MFQCVVYRSKRGSGTWAACTTLITEERGGRFTLILTGREA